MVRKSSSTNPRNHTLILNHSDGKDVKVVVQQTANDVDQVKVATQQTAFGIDQVKRLSSHPISADYGPLRHLREATTRKHSQMALPTESFNKS